MIPPDCNAAERDNTGHPRLPVRAGIEDDNESDYGGSEDDEDDPAKLKNFNVKESFHHAQAVQKRSKGLLGNPGRPVQKPSAATLGVWSDLRYDTIPEARNLIQWMLAGCPRVCAMFVYLCDHYGQNPLHLRTPGIQYLIRQQNSAQQPWLVLTTGDATPMSCRGEYQGMPPASRTQNREQWPRTPHPRCMKRPRTHTAPPVHEATPPAQPTVADMDEPMPAPSGHQEDLFEPSYLGRSPPPAGDDPSDAASASASLTRALDAASQRSPRLWSPGARNIRGEWPAATDMRGTRMLPNDARAMRFVNFIAPLGEGTSIDRTRFVDLLIRRFSVLGLFERHVQRGQWVDAALTLEHYPFDCSDLTLLQVFSWHPAAAAFAASAALNAPATPQPSAAAPPPAPPLNPAPFAPDVEMQPAEDGEIPENGTPMNGGTIIVNGTGGPPPDSWDAPVDAANIPLPDEGED
ncbi:hypothetical protein C8F04DRAFT_1173352 [Mycena alexandri]|uniref:Uncharacterized protein n=1 Tax=Mycena alexandri TaxID=1745969 RepID=A0AAD6TJF1_9AGAR|nr:hypothetical protein C8F04DRAFT_1173352 [Mycena alexandri]